MEAAVVAATAKSFYLTNAALLVAIVGATVTVSVAWGETGQKVDELERYVDGLDRRLGALRAEQDATGRVLDRLDERSVQQEKTMQAIQRSIENIERRLIARPPATNGAP